MKFTIALAAPATREYCSKSTTIPSALIMPSASIKGIVDSRNITGAIPPTVGSMIPDNRMSPKHTSHALPVDDIFVITMYRNGATQETAAPNA